MKKIIALFAVLTVFASVSRAQNVVKETFDYAVKGADTLRIDKYHTGSGEARPCLLFMFGGGFVSGARDREKYLGWFEHFARKGFVVVSIDYRLGLKPLATGEIPADGLKAKDFVAMFENSVYMAVEDLYDATCFVVANAPEWGVEPERIVAAGSSAGAVAVLQGEYERANGSDLSRRLPEGFRYGGVIAFAGAVYGNSGRPAWASEPAPLMMFHGDADRNVPYGRKRVFRYGLYGSGYLAGRYAREDFPFWLHTVENTGHSVAESPMTGNLEETEAFLRMYVLEGRKMQTFKNVSYPDRPKVKKRFGIREYARANFGK